MCSYELTLQIENKMHIRIVKLKYIEAFWGLTFIIFFKLQDKCMYHITWRHFQTAVS